MAEKKSNWVRTIRRKNVSMAIFENEWEDRKYLGFKFQKSYRNKQTKQWVNTDNFDDGSLPDLLVLIQSYLTTTVTEMKKGDKKGVAAQGGAIEGGGAGAITKEQVEEVFSEGGEPTEGPPKF